jgi:hypothetical protein
VHEAVTLMGGTSTDGAVIVHNLASGAAPMFS